MTQRIFQVDAFTDKIFAGNPAGVCPLPGPVPDAWMQAVAAEMNCAETAFFWPEGTAWRLRWCTPTVEVDLCGHATLSAAHIAWSEGMVPENTPISFVTRSGTLIATANSHGTTLDFPAKPALAMDAAEGLLSALGLEPQEVRYIGRSIFDFLVEVTDEATLRRLKPDIQAVRELESRAIIVTAAAKANASYDFVSRFFAPAVGVDEDHVTGSAHCTLAPHWHQRLARETLLGYQASPRGGFVHVRHVGDRVHLTGQAVTALRGELMTPAPAGANPQGVLTP